MEELEEEYKDPSLELPFKNQPDLKSLMTRTYLSSIQRSRSHYHQKQKLTI